MLYCFTNSNKLHKKVPNFKIHPTCLPSKFLGKILKSLNRMELVKYTIRRIRIFCAKFARRMSIVICYSKKIKFALTGQHKKPFCKFIFLHGSRSYLVNRNDFALQLQQILKIFENHRDAKKLKMNTKTLF